MLLFTNIVRGVSRFWTTDAGIGRRRSRRLERLVRHHRCEARLPIGPRTRRAPTPLAKRCAHGTILTWPTRRQRRTPPCARWTRSREQLGAQIAAIARTCHRARHDWVPTHKVAAIAPRRTKPWWGSWGGRQRLGQG